MEDIMDLECSNESEYYEENTYDDYDPYELEEYLQIQKKEQPFKFPSAVCLRECYEKMKEEFDRRAKILSELTKRG